MASATQQIAMLRKIANSKPTLTPAEVKTTEDVMSTYADETLEVLVIQDIKYFSFIAKRILADRKAAK